MKKIEFKIIRDSSYSDEINEILNEEDMESLIKIKYLKIPNLYEALKMDGVKEPIIVIGIDNEKNKLVGVGACTIFENNIGYLNSFRIKKEYRSKIKFSEAYRKIIEETKKIGIKLIITTILAENKLAEKILSKKRKNMPLYEFYKNINFYSIKNKNIGKEKIEDEKKLEYKNFEIYIKNKVNKVYISEDYKGIYKCLYKIRKIISFFGYPELPEKNKKLNFLYVDIISKNGNYSNYLDIIKFLQKRGFNCNFFMIGCFENSEVDNKLKKIKTFKYKSKLYEVYYEEDKNRVVENELELCKNQENKSENENKRMNSNIEIKFWNL